LLGDVISFGRSLSISGQAFFLPEKQKNQILGGTYYGSLFQSYRKRRHRSNTLTAQELARANKAFVGIYRRFLLEALADDKKEASQDSSPELSSYNRNLFRKK